MFYQNTLLAPIDFQKYACRFADICYAGDVLFGMPISLTRGIEMWKEARRLGIISGDLNHDGDFDDPGEDEILDDDRLFKLIGLPLKTVDIYSLGVPLMTDKNGIRRIAPTIEPFDLKKYWVLEAWRWKYLHFVVGRGDGSKPVIFDPINGGSNSVRYGKIESLRIFEIC